LFEGALVVAVKVWVPLAAMDAICGETARVVTVGLPAFVDEPPQPARKSVEVRGRRQANGKHGDGDQGRIEPQQSGGDGVPALKSVC
jgi:hypothetical protein